MVEVCTSERLGHQNLSERLTQTFKSDIYNENARSSEDISEDNVNITKNEKRFSDYLENL